MKKLRMLLKSIGFRRIIIFLILLFLILSPTFASGVGKWFKAIGGAIMAVAGVIAAPFTGGASLSLTAAGVSLTASGINDFAQEDKKKLEEQQKYVDAYNEAYDNYASQQSEVNSINASIAQTQTQILQTEANISAYDQSLVRWQSQADQQRQQLQMQGEAAYSELMQNWQGAELVNATRGQTGGSAALVAESQAAQVERLAGKDMLLDDDGGLFGTAMNEYRLDMLAGRTELVGNMKIQQQALAVQQSALASYQSSLSIATERLETAKQNANAARQQAIDKGVSEDRIGSAL